MKPVAAARARIGPVFWRAVGRISGRPFHIAWWHNRNTWRENRWFGISVLKCPLDLWVYQEILHEVRPSLIIETGTFRGGSALYLAHLMDRLEVGEILTIDVQAHPDRPDHPRITYLTGSSIGEDIIEQVRTRAADAQGPVMVILDSDHRAPHVAAELVAYAPMVTPGSYLIVEDTNVHGRPINFRYGPGPTEALKPFLRSHPEFEVDASRERMILTFNPRGYLRRAEARST